MKYRITPESDAFERTTKVLFEMLTIDERLNMSDALALMHLGFYGPSHLGRVAHRTGLTNSGVTQLAIRLEQCGLAQREVSPSDPRAKALSLTSDGVDIVEQAMKAWKY